MFNKSELNQLYCYCFTLANHEANAYDLLQTALEKFIRNPPNEINTKNSYIRKIIRNQFIDNYRADHKTELHEFDENSITKFDAKLSCLDDILINQESVNMIWDLLDSSEREIMYLWAIQGMTTKEVAHFLEIPKGTIVSKISRLRKKVISKLSTKIEYDVDGAA